MAIEVSGRIDRRSGSAVTLLLLVERLAGEHGLDHEANLSGHLLRVVLSAAESPITRERECR